MKERFATPLSEHLPCRSWILMYLASRMEIHATNNDATVVLSRKYLENFYSAALIARTLFRMRKDGLAIVDGNNIYAGSKFLLSFE